MIGVFEHGVIIWLKPSHRYVIQRHPLECIGIVREKAKFENLTKPTVKLEQDKIWVSCVKLSFDRDGFNANWKMLNKNTQGWWNEPELAEKLALRL